jgi:hypothetical protein
MTPTRTSRPAWAAAPLMLGFVLVLTLWLVFGHSHSPVATESPQASDFISLPIKPGTPCPDAYKMTVAEAQAVEEARVWLPASPRLPEMTGAWMCFGTPTFDYGGITFAYEPGWKLDDPTSTWREMAEQWGRGSVGTVLGRPAFVLPPSDDAPRGEILVVVDDTLIRVGGDGKTSIGDLESAVETIKAPIE